MKSVFVLFTAAVLFSACSASKEIETNSLNQLPCRNENPIDDPKEFVSETVENLDVYQQGELVFASMDVRTYCNAKIAFDIERKDQQIMLKLRNASNSKDQCACITNVTTSFKNVEAGDYTIVVTNNTGYQLLAQTSATVR